ncbi:uncharacterized protein A4U43_C05F34250 [Asparagus officinalis]|uniref:Rad21/Rec8-like protein N-terminal domain-containing protein n=1 Tax=Asparagus officinalis TaxID=4686 RepID=A0A5P1F235_ASPOF|nr:uncharacterized protein A4U43_C05F34250 [Asparagus officinalis]
MSPLMLNVSCMFPEVPIALRLSGHLLYGLVRIYSMKVKYLIQDCNRMVDDIRRVFTSVQVNLPGEADHAPFESLTLPSTFNLDAMELDYYPIDEPDNHRKPHDQITIQDQMLFEEEQYVSIFIDEDKRTDSSPRPNTSNPSAEPMEEDILPPPEGERIDLDTHNDNGVGIGWEMSMYSFLLPFDDNDIGDLDTTAKNVVGTADHAPNTLNEAHFSHESPEIMRDAVHYSERELDGTTNDFAGVNEQSVPSFSKDGNLSPIAEGLSASDEGSVPSAAHNKVTAVASADDLNIPSAVISLGQHLPDVELQPSPPVNQNTRRKRKMKQFFDQSIVLTNAEVKAQLDNTSALVCKRRKLPCSVLDLWRFSRTRQNDRTFHEPLLHGMSDRLREVFERRFPRVSESISLETSSGHMDAPEVEPVLPDMDVEPERLRFANNADEVTDDLVRPASEREEFTPSTAKILGSVSDKGRSIEPEVLPTFEKSASAEPVRPELATPTISVNFDEELHLDDSNIRGFPTLQNSTDIEELTFLEASNASSSCDVTEAGTMSATTRKVAQYLKELSPTDYTPENQSGCLSLNTILERKTRKQCARMFFETLVLKSYGLIDVQQEEAYGDILISRTPALSSAKF